MSKTTGPIMVAGGLTWANQTVLSDDPSNQLFEKSVRIAMATALLGGLFFGIEKISPNIAEALAYAALVTTVVVRVNGKPTPLERLLDLVN